MAVGAKELRRGIDLGVYPDEEKLAREERRVRIAEQGAARADRREERAVSTEERMAESQALRDKLALSEGLTKQIQFNSSQNAIELEIAIKQRALEAMPKIKALNPRSSDYLLKRSAALGDDYRVGILLKDELAVNDDSYKGWMAKQDDDQKNASAWESEHGVVFPRKPDGTLDHVTAGKMRREGATKRGLTDETMAPGGSTFKRPNTEAASIPAGASTAYSNALGSISGNKELLKSQPKDAKVLSEITQQEEIVRSLEALHPTLRATRGLDTKPSVTPTAPAPATTILVPANTPAVSPVAQPAADPAAAHPMEGQIVKQKSTGKSGRIVNGQFVEQ